METNLAQRDDVERTTTLYVDGRPIHEIETEVQDEVRDRVRRKTQLVIDDAQHGFEAACRQCHHAYFLLEAAMREGRDCTAERCMVEEAERQRDEAALRVRFVRDRAREAMRQLEAGFRVEVKRFRARCMSRRILSPVRRNGITRTSRRGQHVARVAAKATATGDPEPAEGPRRRASHSSRGGAL